MSEAGQHPVPKGYPTREETILLLEKVRQWNSDILKRWLFLHHEAPNLPPECSDEDLREEMHSSEVRVRGFLVKSVYSEINEQSISKMSAVFDLFLIQNGGKPFLYLMKEDNNE